VTDHMVLSAAWSQRELMLAPKGILSVRRSQTVTEKVILLASKILGKLPVPDPMILSASRSLAGINMTSMGMLSVSRILGPFRMQGQVILLAS
jgi:hypothetical protein